MLKSIPRLFIGLFLLVFLLTGFLVACLYFKTGNINEAFNLKQFSNLKHNEGFLLPDGGGQYALIGYTDVSTDGKSALVIGKILEINKNGNEVSGKVVVSENRMIVDVKGLQGRTLQAIYSPSTSLGIIDVQNNL
ncbi:MAG: hypothetical protein ABFC57_08730 [Veillonellales bacterium]